MSALTDTLIDQLNILLESGSEIKASEHRAFELQIVAAIGLLESRARGNTILSGDLNGGTPSAASGMEGDLFVAQDTLDFWQYEDGEWVHLFNFAPTRTAFVPVAANQYGTHPAFSSQLAWNVWLTQHLGSGTAPAPTVPGQVSGVTATAGNGQVVLAWSDPATGGSPILSYRLKYLPVGASTYSVFGTTANLTLPITGLTNGQAYQFTVEATNAIGTGAASAPVTATPVAPVATTPALPTVTFDAVNRLLTAYHVLGTGQLEYRHSGGSPLAYATVTVDAASHLASEWEYRVKAAPGRNVSGWAPSPAIGPAGSGGGSQLAAPLGVAAEATSSTEGGVSWFTVTGNTAYIAQLAEDSAFTVGLQAPYRPINSSSASFTGLTASTTYYVRVQALAADPANNSAYSAVVSFATPAAPVTGYAYNWEAEGDSLTADPARNGYAGNFFRQAQTALATNPQHGGWLNFATAGEGIAGSMNTGPEINEVLSGKSLTAINFLSLLAGINDLQGGATGVQSSGSYLGLLSTYTGYVYRNIAYTLTVSRADALPNHRAVYEQIQIHNNAVRQAFNTGTLSAVLLIDIVTDPRLYGYNASLNTAYFRPDHIHYNETGGTPIITEMLLRGVPFLESNTRKVITAAGEFDTATLMPVDVVVQDPNTTAITYTGTFTPFSGGGPTYFGGSFRYTSTVGDSYAYTVPAGGYNAVTMEGYTDSGGGTFDAFVNNVLVGSGTMSISSGSALGTYFTFTNLVAGDVVKLVKTGSTGSMYADQIVAFYNF